MCKRCDEVLAAGARSPLKQLFTEALSTLQEQWQREFVDETDLKRKIAIYRHATALLDRPFLYTPCTYTKEGHVIVAVAEA